MWTFITAKNLLRTFSVEFYTWNSLEFDFKLIFNVDNSVTCQHEMMPMTNFALHLCDALDFWWTRLLFVDKQSLSIVKMMFILFEMKLRQVQRLIGFLIVSKRYWFIKFIINGIFIIHENIQFQRTITWFNEKPDLFSYNQIVLTSQF